jgi:hypothetical protein
MTIEMLRDLETRLEALKLRRAMIPPGELREFDEFVSELQDKIELLRSAGLDRPLN